MIPSTRAQAESIATALQGALEPRLVLTRAEALDVLARTAGQSDWRALDARLAQPAFGSPMPILRVSDSALARRFYLDWLGFTIDFEHRFEPALPLFTAISREDAALGLSEHSGDGTPGSVVWLPVRGLEAFRQTLVDSPADSQRPGIDPDAPGGPTMEVTDPFGNVLRLCEPTASRGRAALADPVDRPAAS
jgi:catechol 2,3-dioxygenase-like lactoylglutathione lyase family enzyme